MQTRAQSLLEACANTAIGYGVAIVSQILIFPMFGIHIPTSSHLAIGLWFLVISVVRSYILRRLFNRFKSKS